MSIDHNLIQAARESLATFLHQNPLLSSWDALVDYAHLTIADSTIEKFHVLHLDNKNRLIADVQMGIGTVNHVPVYVREVVRQALLNNAKAMILVHNHPSGDPTPSDADIKMTKSIIKAADLFDITVHDHLVVCPNTGTEYSFRAHGLI